MISAQNFVKSLELEVLVGTQTQEWDLQSSDINRPGLQLAGYYDYFAYERPQVIGKSEMSYLLSLEEPLRRERLKTYLSYAIPCIVITRGLEYPEELLELAKEAAVPVYRTQSVTTQFSTRIISSSEVSQMLQNTVPVIIQTSSSEKQQ